MSNRRLVEFDMTREEIPPLDGHDWTTTETPYSAAMANEDLRVVCRDRESFQKILALACQMIEKANPGMLAALTDPETDQDGYVTRITVTVIPSRELPRETRQGQILASAIGV
jgi:hypothetical protein